MMKHPYRRRLLGGSLLAALTLGALGTDGLWAQGTGNEPMPGMNMGPTPMPGMNLGPTPTPGSAAPPTPSSGPAAMPPGMSSGVTQMNGLTMPPGMIMTPDMTMQQLQDMAAVDTSKVTYSAPADARGDQTLQPTVIDGVKTFDLETSIVQWNILPNVQVAAYAFNRQVPGPRIRLNEGEKVRINREEQPS